MSGQDGEPVGVVGVGWVGLVTAACFASRGHDVWAMDVDADKVARLSAGELTIHEPGLGELIAGSAGRLNFTTSMEELLAGARLLFCCVDTPPTYSGDADLSRVRAVVGQLSGDSEHALVMKSTVPSGTGQSIRRDLPSLSYVSCPEFLKEGSAVEDFLHPDRVVIGSDPGDAWAAEAVTALYEPLGGEIVRTDVASAEMIKLASNAFLATKISFINEIANVCEEVGADVTEVARGMGLDERIGNKFLHAGIGYGGSCLIGEETVLVRRGREVGLRRLDELFGALAIELDADLDATLLEPAGLEVLALGDDGRMSFGSVSAVTSRTYDGDLVTVRTMMGRRVRCTADHPFTTVEPDTQAALGIKTAAELTTEDWVPLGAGPIETPVRPTALSVPAGMRAAGLDPSDVIIRPEPAVAGSFAQIGVAERERALGDHPRGFAQRSGDIHKSGSMRLDEALDLSLSLRGALAGTARNGTYVPFDLALDERFWRVVGLYIAEGHCSVDGAHDRHRMAWSFHPTKEEHFVDEVMDFWTSRGVKATRVTTPTTRGVRVSSKILARWWLDLLRVGADCYTHRIPDLAWSQPRAHRRALLSGMWDGDGSWSLVNGGPSVVLEYGTTSAELADGIMRLLQMEDLIAGQRIGRGAKSTVDTHWLRISGAEQVERALFLVPADARSQISASLAKQSKRIRSTGFRRQPGRIGAVRVVSHERSRFRGRVFSLEVTGSHTFATTGGLVTHNCFPKDVSALKQLAGNSGYHFQLLNSVIEVNELQKRRVIGKITKHLGSLVGKRVALLGLAFKANTDDMREASSLVLSARLQGEGATVVAYDPVAHAGATGLLPSVVLAGSAEEALDGADAAILVTEWPEFSELDWAALAARMANPLIVDGRNFLDPDALRAAGLTYEGIGRGGPTS